MSAWVWILVGLFGCAGLQPGGSETGDGRIPYRGFSIPPPPSDDWFLRKEQQSESQAIVWRKTGSDTHSLLVAVDLRYIGAQPESHEAMARAARADDIENRARYELLSYEHELVTLQGQWCIRYERRILDRYPSGMSDVAQYVLSRGARCLHPLWPGTLIDRVFVERGLREELDPALQQEAERYLAGISIEVAPGVPATAPSNGEHEAQREESAAPTP